MRLALVRNVGLSMLALGVFAVAGCNNNPIDYDAKTTTAIQIVPTTMVLGAGRSEQIQVTPINQGFEPTGVADVAFSIISCGVGGAEIAVVPDTEQQLPILPPMSRWRINAAAAIGQTCVVWASQGIQDTMLITVVPEGLSLVSAPQSLRSGESGTIVLNLVDADGNVIGTLDPTILAWSSEDSGLLPVDASGNIGPAVVTDNVIGGGSVVITATWTGDEETATAGLGVSREIDTVVDVFPTVPATARLDPAVAPIDTLTMIPDFGAFLPGEEVRVEVQVLDANGNQNKFASEITGATIVSSNPLAVNATVAVVPDLDDPTIVTIAGVLNTVLPVGTVAISGTVTTTSGVLPYNGVITVLAPAITGLSVDNGDYATTGVTITGSGFTAPGFAAKVTVGGSQLGNYTVDSDNSITAQMPTYSTAGARTVIVDMGGVLSNGVTWTQNNACDSTPFVPGNNAPGGAQAVSLPLSCTGTFTGDLVNVNQWFVMEVSADALLGMAAADWFTTASWTPNKDLDVLTCDGALGCAFAIDPSGGTHNEDVTAGDWYLWMNDFAAEANGDTTPATYLLESSLNP